MGDVRGRGFDEGGVERVLVGAGDGDLGEEGEGDGVVDGAELGDLLVGAGLLAGEVVGGEAEDDEAAIFVVLVEGFEGGVLRGEAALAGDVHDEEEFAGVVGECGGGAGDGGEGDGGEGRHGDSLARRWEWSGRMNRPQFEGGCPVSWAATVGIIFCSRRNSAAPNAYPAAIVRKPAPFNSPLVYGAVRTLIQYPMGS